MARIEARWIEAAAAAGASALFAAMFLEWHGRRTGWEASPYLAVVVFLALVVSVLQVVLRTQGRERVLPVPGVLVGVLGILATALAAREIVSPSGYEVGPASAAPYAAVAFAALVALGGLASIVARGGVRNVTLGRVGGTEIGIAATAAALLASMFLPWFTPEGDRHPKAPAGLSAWATEDWLDIPLLVTAGAALAYVLHRAGASRGVRVLPGIGLAAAALLCAWLVVDRIREPPTQARYGVFYDAVGIGSYLGLACCVALALAGLAHAAAARPGAMLWRELRVVDSRMGLGPRPEGGGGSAVSWPVASGVAVLVVLSVLLLLAGVALLGPIPVAILLAGGLVGFVLARWWLPLLPVPAAAVIVRFIPDRPCSSQASECYGNFFEVLAVYSVAVLITGGLLVGVAMRRLDARARRAAGAAGSRRRHASQPRTSS